MFGENLKAMRKAKGYTQQELAMKLNVVRQTVSKWEKGLSVPDAEILVEIADVLDTDVSVLLGKEVSDEESRDEVAIQLAKISEQLAIKNRKSKRIWKAVGIILLVIIVLNIILIIFGGVASKGVSTNVETGVVEQQNGTISGLFCMSKGDYNRLITRSYIFVTM